MTRVPTQGDRIRLISIDNDPNPVMIGEEGMIVNINCHGSGGDFWEQFDVCWDNGRNLMLISPPNVFKIIQKGERRSIYDTL